MTAKNDWITIMSYCPVCDNITQHMAHLENEDICWCHKANDCLECENKQDLMNQFNYDEETVDYLEIENQIDLMNQFNHDEEIEEKSIIPVTDTITDNGAEMIKEDDEKATINNLRYRLDFQDICCEMAVRIMRVKRR